jgi:A nuclease of the HNH/ENDO VII superfamily with conserved WHH
VLNQPLKYTDPSGYCAEIVILGVQLTSWCRLGGDDGGRHVIDGAPGSFVGDNGPKILDGDPGSFGSHAGSNTIEERGTPPRGKGDLIVDGDPDSFSRDDIRHIVDGDPRSFGGPRSGTTIVASTNSKPKNSGISVENGGPGKHPITAVPFVGDYPDFSDHLYPNGTNDVVIEPTGDRHKDSAEANRIAGYKQTPKNYTWHHHQDYGRMQLVDKSIHRNTGHSGGFSEWPNRVAKSK